MLKGVLCNALLRRVPRINTHPRGSQGAAYFGENPDPRALQNIKHQQKLIWVSQENNYENRNAHSFYWGEIPRNKCGLQITLEIFCQELLTVLGKETHRVFSGSFMTPGRSLKFLKDTEPAVLSFESEMFLFQIPEPGGSLILNGFK